MMPHEPSTRLFVSFSESFRSREYTRRRHRQGQRAERGECERGESERGERGKEDHILYTYTHIHGKMY